MNETPPVMPFSKRVSDRTPQPAFIDVNADSQSIAINASVTEVYAHCARFENLPRFITSLRDVQTIDENNFSCTSVINRQEVKSDVQIILRVPNRRLAWQAVSDNFRIGVAVFTPRPDGTTEVMIKIRSIVEPVTLSGALRQYLTNFKRFVEERRTEMN